MNLHISNLAKRVGATQLFSEFSCSLEPGTCLGLVGANGCGKSTLLRIIAGLEEADSGSVVIPSDVVVRYLPQATEFPAQHRLVGDVLEAAVQENGSPIDGETKRLLAVLRDRFALPADEHTVEGLSGGEAKRLHIAAALCSQADIMLLDEPTNHLDIHLREALEQWIIDSSQTWIIVSHDRWLLNNVVDHILEINARYPGSALWSTGTYSDFLERKSTLLADLEQQHTRMENIARREQAWLRQGAKARSTKSKHRTEKAQQLLENLKSLKRVAPQTQGFAFEASGRASSMLLRTEKLSFSYPPRRILNDLSLEIVRGTSIGLLGANGTGKSTLLKLLLGSIAPESGSIQRRNDLAIGVFEQRDPHSSSSTTLREFFAPTSDSVHYRGNAIHVAAWATRFGFRHEQLVQPLRALSGGERARARLALLLTQRVDLLLLDEPTNDLDIPTLELLEESLCSFDGAIVLISHDRYFLSRVCTSYLGFQSGGRLQSYAEITQWLRETAAPSAADEMHLEISSSSERGNPAPVAEARQKNTSRKLSYSEQREYQHVEQEILRAEEHLAQLQNALAQESSSPDYYTKLAQAQAEVERLYARWEELEKKLTS